MNLTDKFKSYLSFLKDVSQKEETINEDGILHLQKKGNKRRCHSVSLFLSKYFVYQDKKDIQFQRCLMKPEKKLYCHLHFKMNEHLNSMVHELESYEDFRYVIDNIKNKKRVNQKLEEWIKDDKMKLYILYFFLIYEIAIREERNYICHYYSMDEGHIIAIDYRKELLTNIEKRMGFERFANIQLLDACKYFDTILFYRKEFKILAMDISKIYIFRSSFFKAQKNRRLICDILNTFIEDVDEDDYIPVYYNGIEELVSTIVKENRDIFATEDCRPILEEVTQIETEIKEDDKDEDVIYVPLYEGPSRKKKIKKEIIIDQSYIYEEYNNKTKLIILDIVNAYQHVLKTNLKRLTMMEEFFRGIVDMNSVKMIEELSSLHFTKEDVLGSDCKEYMKHILFLNMVKEGLPAHDNIFKNILLQIILYEFSFYGSPQKYELYYGKLCKNLVEELSSFLDNPYDSVLAKWIAQLSCEESLFHSLYDLYACIHAYDYKLYFRISKSKLFNEDKIKLFKNILSVSSSMKIGTKILCDLLEKIFVISKDFINMF